MTRPPADGRRAGSAGDGGGGGGAHRRGAGVRPAETMPGRWPPTPGAGGGCSAPCRGYRALRGSGRCDRRPSVTTRSGMWTTPADSVFCSPRRRRHRPLGRGARPRARGQRPGTWDRRRRSRRRRLIPGSGLCLRWAPLEQDKELQAIFERTYGPGEAAGLYSPERPPAPCSDSGGRAGKADHPGAGSPARSTCWWTGTTSFSPGTS